MRTTKSTKLASLGVAWFKKPLALAFTLILAFSVSPAFAAAEAHPQIGEFGSFSNPNGIAVDESTGDVYVADLGTDTVYKFDASGSPLDFAALSSNALTGAATPAKSFSFPSVSGTPAAIAVDNSSSPSAGDLYVMDAGNGVIDKFSPEGTYLSQIGGFTGELLGLGIDQSGTVHVVLNRENHDVLVEEFDGTAANHHIAHQLWTSQDELRSQDGVPVGGENKTDGFAVSATGDDYQVYEPSCSCTTKWGQKLSPLGRVESGEAGDVAVAVDPVTGHLYADDQSSVAEWDTGAMNRNSVNTEGGLAQAAGTLVTRFGSAALSGTSAEGGIAVDGATGDVFVSNTGDGKVDVFASDAPAVTVGEPAGVGREAATLKGTIDPRGAAVSSCEFEYNVTDEFGSGPYDLIVPCAQSPAEIGAGSAPVSVSAELEGLAPGELYHFRLVAINASGEGHTSGMLATQGVGFGIKTFEVSFLNEDGTPDTQAGSHPYQFVSEFTLNTEFKRSVADADSPYIRLPVAPLRDLKVDLPPGFVGDPNASPKKCTGAELLTRANWATAQPKRLSAVSPWNGRKTRCVKRVSQTSCTTWCRRGARRCSWGPITG